MFFGQTFDPTDLGVIALLVLLEGALSVDNALVLAVIASRAPAQKGAAALRYGLVLSFVFRAAAVAAASLLIRWPLVKLIGAAYLAYLGIRRFCFTPPKLAHTAAASTTTPGEPFWKIVLAIEFTDMAFAVDNVLAAVALVGAPPADAPPTALHPKFWVILTGGMLGVILSRFAAAACLRLMRRFTRLETFAYVIVLTIAAKLALEWAGVTFHDVHQAPFWIFSITLVVCVAAGFIPPRRPNMPPPPPSKV